MNGSRRKGAARGTNLGPSERVERSNGRRSTVLRWLAAGTFLGLAWLATIASGVAAELRGKVVDLGRNRQGVDAAEVELHLLTPEEWEGVVRGSKHLPKDRAAQGTELTDEDGKFQFDKVESERVCLRVRCVGFIADPTEKPVSSAGASDEVVVSLLDVKTFRDPNRRSAYVAGSVQSLKRLYGVDEKALQHQWQEVGRFGLTPSEKRLFAVEFEKAYPVESLKIPAIKKYREADPVLLDRTSQLWGEGLLKPDGRLPEIDANRGVDKIIVADIFQDLLQKSPLEGPKKKQLIEDFNQKWKPDLKLDLDRLRINPKIDLSPPSR